VEEKGDRPKGQEELLGLGPLVQVMTVNADRYGFPKEEKIREAAFHVFKQEGAKGTADIVGFQEFVKGARDVYGKARPDLEFVEGEEFEDLRVNSFAFKRDRLKLIDAGTLWLSPDRTKVKVGNDALIPRAMTWGILQDRHNDRRFLFQNLHPDNVGILARKVAFEIVREEADKHGLPTIVTADSNLSVHSPNRERWSNPEFLEPYTSMLKAGFRDAWCEVHPGEVRPSTFHAHRGPRYNALLHDGFGTADTEWIMYRGPFRVFQSWVVYDHYKHTFPSDHYPMQAIFAWTK
jgi:endonuclease/exonuclease/phosphatase family metal-dependent hydrolase